jgi:hypothetical protein
MARGQRALRITKTATGIKTSIGSAYNQRGPNMKTVAGHHRSAAHRKKIINPRRAAQ